MFSIRRARLFPLIASLLLLGGCEFTLHPEKPWNGDISQAPIQTDPAMQLRNWGPTDAIYGSGVVTVHPFYAPFLAWQVNNRYTIDWLPQVVAFLGNTFYLPVGIFIQAPWIVMPDVAITPPPSYTLMPVLPTGPQQPSTY